MHIGPHFVAQANRDPFSYWEADEAVKIDLNCTVIEVITAVKNEDGSEGDANSFVCSIENGLVFEVTMDDATAVALNVTENSAFLYLTIKNAVIQSYNGHGLIDLNAEGTTYSVLYGDRTFVSSDRQEERRLSNRALSEQWQGHRSLAAFRIVCEDKEPTLSVDEISDALFGTFGDNVTLHSIYNDCSFGKFSFDPAEGLDLKNGVQEISLPGMKADGNDRINLQNAATEELVKRYGSNLADKYEHVTYILPPGTYRNKPGEKWFA